MRLWPKKTEEHGERVPQLPALMVEQPRINTTLPENATDESVITLWLKQHAILTQEAYARDLRAFLAFTQHIPLRSLTLADLHAYKDSLSHLAEATAARRISAVKSLLTFCHESGYTPVQRGRGL